MNASSPQRTVYRSLDAWRGIASLWVVMIHSCLPAITGPFPDLRFQPLYAFSLYGSLGVQMFFVISGYCIANAAASIIRKNHSLLKFLQARVRRIYPPYFFSFVLAAILSIIVAHFVATGKIKGSALAQNNILHQHFLYYISSLTITQVPTHQQPLLAVYWTLCYEIAFYAIVGLFLLPTRIRNERGLMNSMHCVTILTLLLLIISPRHVPFPFDLWPQFGLGVMVYDILQKPTQRYLRAFWLAIILETAGFIVLHSIGGDISHKSSRLTFGICLAFALALIVLHRYDDMLTKAKVTKLFAWIGTFSYSLYLTHLLCLGIISQIGKRLGVTEHTYIIVYILEIALSIGFAWIFYRFFEKPFLSIRDKNIHFASPPIPVSQAEAQVTPSL
jgi:exopolysaccharide production protein ExoZ